MIGSARRPVRDDLIQDTNNFTAFDFFQWLVEEPGPFLIEQTFLLLPAAIAWLCPKLNKLRDDLAERGRLFCWSNAKLDVA